MTRALLIEKPIDAALKDLQGLQTTFENSSADYLRQEKLQHILQT